MVVYIAACGVMYFINLSNVYPWKGVHVYMYIFCRKNFPPGEFREIRETSRRENFPRRISGNPGNFPAGNFPSVVYTTLHYVFL